jgi:hypothetical protein
VVLSMLMEAKCGNLPTGKVADKTVKAKYYAICWGADNFRENGLQIKHLRLAFANRMR